MHDQQWDNLKQTVGRMTDAEKLELIEHLVQSVRASKNGVTAEYSAAQKQRLLESIRRISALPVEGPGRFSGRDHDQVLYGPGVKPEAPT